MTDKLLIQSVGSGADDRFKRYMDLEEPIHREYAKRCDADYEFFEGYVEGLNPTWNRIRLMLDAFDDGYRKVAWLDADTLVVNLDEDVFEKTSNDAPVLMTRVASAHVEMPWMYDTEIRAHGLCGALTSPPNTRRCALEREDYGALKQEQLAGSRSFHVGDHADGDGSWPQWDVYNDGVLIVNDDEHGMARECLAIAWENRRAPFKPWHVPGMPELDWLLDYAFHVPNAIGQLHGRWNWMGYDDDGPRDEAVIMAWHGHPGEQRFAMFKAAYDEFYG